MEYETRLLSWRSVKRERPGSVAHGPSQLLGKQLANSLEGGASLACGGLPARIPATDGDGLVLGKTGGWWFGFDFSVPPLGALHPPQHPLFVLLRNKRRWEPVGGEDLAHFYCTGTQKDGFSLTRFGGLY